MPETRYLIFNHEAAFSKFVLDGFVPRGDSLVLESGSGVFITPVLDSKEQGCLWKRLLAEIELPADSYIKWRFYRVDKAYESQSLREILQSNAHTMKEKLDLLRRFEVFSAENTSDFLLTEVKGRYVVAAAGVLKHEGSPPAVIRSVQIFSAWESFLPCLPEIFRDEGGFLDRFLRLLSVSYLDMEKSIDSLPESFDPRVASPDMLRRLAGIMGIPHIGLWGTENLRGLLTAGTYRRKGRMSALPEFIEHFTGFRAYVTENFRMMTGHHENDRLYLGSELDLFLPSEALQADLNMDALHLIVQSFLPCGVTYRIQALDTCPVISGHTYLGVNTRLGTYSESVLGVTCRLNFATLGR